MVHQDRNVIEFKRRIGERFDKLISEGALHYNGLPVSIDDVAADYVFAGESFESAERFLISAGFEVSPRPGPHVDGGYPDRYDVYARSTSLIDSKKFEHAATVVIGLRPMSPNDYSVIKSVHAFVMLKAL